MNMQTRQHGGSGFGMIITLLIIGYGVFIGIQYVPQYLEAATVKTILDNIVEKNKNGELSNTADVRSAIDNQLYINEMTNLGDSFTVTQNRGHFVIKVQYERELNLLYEKKQIPYETMVTLE